MGSANGKIGFIFPACYLYSMSVQRILSVAIILVLLDTFLSRQSFAPPVYVEPFLYVLALYFVLVLLGPLLRRLVRKLNPPAVRGGSTVLVSAVNSGVGAMVSRGFLRSISVGAVRQSDTGPSSDALALGPPHELGPRSVLEAGSITKGITSLLLADLVISGTVALEDPVSDYLPLPQLQDVTLEHLATHRSGQPRMPRSWHTLLGGSYKSWTTERLLRSVKPSTPTEQPQYSNLGFALLGHALAAACGLRYEELARNRILRPLGMEASDFDLATSVWGRDWMGLPAPSWSNCGVLPRWWTEDDGLRSHSARRILAGSARGTLGQRMVTGHGTPSQLFPAQKGDVPRAADRSWLADKPVRDGLAQRRNVRISLLGRSKPGTTRGIGNPRTFEVPYWWNDLLGVLGNNDGLGHHKVVTIVAGCKLTHCPPLGVRQIVSVSPLACESSMTCSCKTTSEGFVTNSLLNRG